LWVRLEILHVFQLWQGGVLQVHGS
jgi:hypothetical protein